MLLSNVDSGFRLAIPTMVWAARWNTVSISYSASVRSIRSRSRISPRTTLTHSIVRLRTSSLFGTQSRTRQTTSAPALARLRVSQLPSRPVAPVMSVGRSRQKRSFSAMASLGPNLPGRLTIFPEVVQNLEFTIGVHRKKGSVVVVRHQLTLRCQPFQRLMLQNALVAIQVIEHLALEHEESCTGPGIRFRFLDEVLHLVLGVNVEDSEAGNRTKRGYRRQLPMTLVKLDQPSDVNIADAVPIGHHETIVRDVFLGTFQTPSRHRFQARLGQRDAKVLFLVIVVVLDAGLLAEANGEIIVHRLVVQKVLLDHVAPIAQAQDEIPKPMVGIEFHDVPEDGVTPYIH